MLGGVHVGCWEIFGPATIQSMRDFKGKTVPSSRPTVTDGMFMAMTLTNVGLDLNKDVKLVNYKPTEPPGSCPRARSTAVVAFPPTSTRAWRPRRSATWCSTP